MKTTAAALAIVLLAALGAAYTLGSAQEAPPEPAAAPAFVKTPAAPLHKDFERARTAASRAIADYTVSVEIDYDRSGPAVPRMIRPGQANPNDPFFRYDLGPFSGLVVGTGRLLISDRCLGEFNAKGASPRMMGITVTLPNGDRWPARVVGRYQIIDLALIEVDCDIPKACPGMKVVQFASGEVKLERGQSVIVVGRGQNPLGLLVNSGIVSALQREGTRAFQLDARIGNSTLGAPVVDIAGRLVGLVTLHNHNQFGQASGVSFAAYIHEVREALKILNEGKFIERPPQPFMGVGTSKAFTDKPGLIVGTVTSNSGAERAGIRTDDIILSINGTDMNDLGDLQALILKHKVGDTLKVKLLRGEEELEVNVTLGPRP